MGQELVAFRMDLCERMVEADTCRLAGALVRKDALCARE